MNVLITQPRYFPSFEMLDRIAMADIVVFLDNTMLDTRAFENRTLIRCDEKPKWLTMPVSKRKIKDAVIKQEFVREHRQLIKEYYGEYSQIFEHCLVIEKEKYIDYMEEHYKKLFEYIGQDKILLKRSQILYDDSTGKEEIKLLLKELNATKYITGDNCLNYGLNQSFLDDIHVELELCNFEERCNDMRMKYDLDARYSIIDTEMMKQKEYRKLSNQVKGQE